MKNEIPAKLNVVEKRIVDAYIARSYNCEDCKEFCSRRGLQLHGPLSYFNVGDTFEKDKYRVAFVGKNTWYDKSDVVGLEFLNSSRFKDCRDDGKTMFLTRRSRFWGFIQDVAKQLYPEEKNEAHLLDRISITNLTKCNTSEGSRDTTPYHMTKNCVEIFEEEIKALQPTHIIFFAGNHYDSYIERLNFGYANSPKDMTTQTFKKEIKNNSFVWWWHRKFSENEELSMDFLRTRHPQGAPKELVIEIVKWIKK